MDVYSLGLVIIEIATLKPSFDIYMLKELKISIQ